jgi:hypothetical protein
VEKKFGENEEKSGCMGKIPVKMENVFAWIHSESTLFCKLVLIE